MNTRDTLIQQVVALFGGPLDAHLLDGIIIVLMAVDSSLEFGRKVRTAGQIRHPIQCSDTGDRHDAGDQGDLDADQIASIAPIVEGRVVEEELRRNPVCTSFGLRLEELELPEPIRSFRMPFWETSDPDAESSWIWMRPLLVETCDMFDEFDGVGVVVGLWVVSCIVDRVITAKSKHVADPCFGVSGENGVNLLRGLLHAGQVRDGIDLATLLKLDHQIMRSLSGRASGAVGDGDERRLQRGEVIHALPQPFQCRFTARREEFETERGSISLDDVLNVHRSAL